MWYYDTGVVMPYLPASDALVRQTLQSVKTIAVVGFSANPARPSYGVAEFLQARGYRIVPVNPGLAGQTQLGETVYATLADIPFPIDMADIFRQSEALPGIVEEVLALQIPVLWTQLGVFQAEALAKAQAAGLTVIANRCSKIELGR
jgi:predicted CoA-binding protein